MIFVLMQRHGGKDLLLDAYHKLVEDIPELAGMSYVLDGDHPEDQVKQVKKLCKLYMQVKDCVVRTNSLTVVYALNNELMRNPKLLVNAYEVRPSGKMNMAIKDRWIDESILGHVADKLQTELNALSAKKYEVEQKKEAKQVAKKR